MRPVLTWSDGSPHLERLLKTPTRRIWNVLWTSVVFLTGWALLMALCIVPLGTMLSAWEASSPLQARLYFDTVGALTMLVATWLALRCLQGLPMASLGLAGKNAGRWCAAGIVTGALWIVASIGVIWAAGWLTAVGPSPTVGAGLALAALGVTLNAFTQQLLLCGFIFQTLRQASSIRVASIVSALLFVAYHAGAFSGGWLPVANVFLAGLLFCVAFEVSKTLWFPFGIHLAWNALLGPVLGLTVSGSKQLGGESPWLSVAGPSLGTGGSFGVEGGLVVSITTAILLLAMVRFGRAKRRLEVL